MEQYKQYRVLGSAYPLTDARFSLRGYLGLSGSKSMFFLNCSTSSIKIRLRCTLRIRCTVEDVNPASQNRSMFILGMGFVGQFFAQELKDLGWSVSGTCRSRTKKEKLNEMGFDAYLVDAYGPEMNVLDILKQHTHLLVSIPPTLDIGDPMLGHEELLRSLLVHGNLKWLSYLSSTGVYGDCGGKLVDESYPTFPITELARLRLAAEEGWSNLGQELGLSSVVFRLGGIYGPGRSAVNTIIKQKPLSKLQTRRALRKYTSRVHVKDICQALKASLFRPSSREVFNIVDDDPAPREEVFTYARKLVGNKWPDLIKQYSEKTELCNFERSNEWGEKRVSNAKMKEELGIRLLYPNYRLGLQSIIDQMECPS